jgi:hypothetical protein
MKTAALFLVVLLHAAAAAAQATGTISGCVTDASGRGLPGVRVVASSGTREGSAITTSSGCYEVKAVLPGAYTLTASLPVFATSTKEGVVVHAGQTTGHVDFELCHTSQTTTIIDWVSPGELADAWKSADVVADLRIVATRSLSAVCAVSDVIHTASVLEVLKKDSAWRSAKTIEVGQEIWSQEPTPFRVGQRLILFLTRTDRGWFVRTFGPAYTFYVNGDSLVAGRATRVNTDGLSVKDFLTQLRGMAKKAER